MGSSPDRSPVGDQRRGWWWARPGQPLRTSFVHGPPAATCEHGHATHALRGSAWLYWGSCILALTRWMQLASYSVAGSTVPKYIEWVVANARKFEEVELNVKGETDEELAASLVAEMLRAGLSWQRCGKAPWGAFAKPLGLGRGALGAFV